MATDSGQRFIRRNRAPRVHITYEDPYNAERRVELPFVMGVMSDLSGNNSSVEKPEIGERKFLEFDMDNFENRMAAIEPGAAFKVDNKLGDGTRRETVGRSSLPEDGRFQPGRGCAAGPCGCGAAGSAHPAFQPLALHGRQSGRGGPDQRAA